MKDLREKIVTDACIGGNTIKSQKKWAGHIASMKDERFRKRTETKQQGGREEQIGGDNWQAMDSHE